MQHWISTAIDFYNRGKTTEARKLFLRILRKIPDEPNCLNYLSIIAFKKGDFKSAEKYVESFLKNDPDNPTFLNRLGQIQLMKKEYDDALKHILLALKFKPDFLEAHFNLSKTYYAKGQQDQAILELQRVLELKPDHQLANKFLEDIKKLQYSQTSTKNLPWDIQTLKRRGESLLKSGSYIEALPVYEQLHSMAPDEESIVFNLGLIHFTMGRYDHAIPYLKKATQSQKSKAINAHCYYLYAKISICDWTNYEQEVQELINLTENYVRTRPDFQIPIYILHYFDVPRYLISESGWHQSHLISQLYPDKIHREKKITQSSGKLRLGYISTKFRATPGGVLFHQVFRYHNRDKFEVIGYALTKPDDNDFFTSHFIEGFDEFRDISSLSDEAGAKIIMKDRIDILITMAGYEDNMRLGILAHQPAPIQINWAGYHESMGSDFIQYSILDQSLNSRGTNKYYKEKILELPGCAMFNSPLETSTTVSKKEYGLPEDSFIYGCLNHPKKITPREVSVWSDILQANENSILWLYDGGIDLVRKNIWDQFKKHDIQSKRIGFMGKETIFKHWSRLKLVDLFLDTFIYNAHVTAIESLRMGTPVLTLEGDTNCGRYGSSILKAAGLPELVCKSQGEYVEKALIYGNAKMIKKLKTKLSANIQNAILFDTKTNITNLETALLEIWDEKY